MTSNSVRDQTFRHGSVPTTTRQVRAGVIGTGFIGEVHARAIRVAGGHLVAVADVSRERATAAATRFGALRSDSAEGLIAATDVDVVHICTPNHLHAALAKLAVRAGKHVICEKPLATTLSDAQALVDAVKDSGVVAAVPFIYRYYPTVREARARVKDGRTGNIRLIHGSYLQDWLSSSADQNWRVDPSLGGASRTFADIGVHWCDLIEFTTGHRITALTARLFTAFPERSAGADGRVASVETEDAATVMFETDRGAVGCLIVSQVTPGRKNRLWFSLDGAETSLAFDQESPESLWVGSRESTSLIIRGAGGMSPDAQRLSVLPAGHPQGYQDCFNGFISDVYASVAGEPIEGLPSFNDGLRAATLTDAVLRSSRRRTWVEVAA